jgi:hypothetical protein
MTEPAQPGKRSKTGSQSPSANVEIVEISDSPQPVQREAKADGSPDALEIGSGAHAGGATAVNGLQAPGPSSAAKPVAAEPVQLSSEQAHCLDLVRAGHNVFFSEWCLGAADWSATFCLPFCECVAW